MSTSAAGTIVYRSASTIEHQLVWYDRSGKELARLGAPSARQAPALSPNGRQIAVTRVVDGNRDIWLVDIARNVYSRFTFDAASDNDPIWTPDGNSIISASNRTGRRGLYQKSSLGARKSRYGGRTDRTRETYT